MTNCRTTGATRRQTTRSTRGRRGEDAALEYLAQAGLALVERNFRCRLGEVDLVMHDSGCLVFVEVRSRASNRFVDPAATVDGAKQRRIVRAAELFIAGRPRYRDCAVRFDVVAIEQANGGAAKIQWIPDAFRV